MKILKPVKTVPPKRQKWGKYKSVWEAVVALPNGDWLPVKCESPELANRLYLAAHTHRSLPMDASRLGDTVYIRPRQRTNGMKAENDQV